MPSRGSEALFMTNLVKKFLREEDGPTAVEYAVMLALIIAVCIGAVNTMAHATADSFDSSAKELAGIFG
jgi:pilus assembly protein Flp/PilA